MPRRSLFWQLFPSYLFISVVVLVGVLVYTSGALRQFYLDEVARDLKARATILDARVHESLVAPDPLSHAQAITEVCREFGSLTATRLTVILPSGAVIGDSDEDPARMENHADRPEVAEALVGRVGRSARMSQTVDESMMYVAVPIMRDMDVLGVIRASVPVTAIDDALASIQFRIGFAGFAIVLLTAWISFFITRRIRQPLEEMRAGAERFASGEFEHKLRVSSTQEFGATANALNQMAAQLDDRIKAVVRQRNELEAVLSSMVEGVLAVDTDERVININHAAAELIGVKPEDALGRTLQEVARNAELQQFVADALVSPISIESDIVLHGASQKILQAHGAVLRDSNSKAIGALVVLNDITRLRKLENIRRDFVANVSHELKTPITSIKGYIETLLDSPPDTPEETRRFLEIIVKHSDRLHNIIEDLLTLSRLEEEDEERRRIALEETSLRGVLNSAIQVCAAKAESKAISILLQCDENLSIRVNPPLLEQALVNLIDNALKYTDAEGTVTVGGRRSNGGVVIEVRDTGSGIPKEHLSRIFERFYRVDKARSRKAGGTGLGLAIVKHIAQAHGGSVSVESIPSKGSRFYIHLPVAASRDEKSGESA